MLDKADKTKDELLVRIVAGEIGILRTPLIVSFKPAVRTVDKMPDVLLYIELKEHSIMTEDLNWSA